MQVSKREGSFKTHDVATGVVTEAGLLGLEVDSVLPAGQVRRGQVGRSGHEFGNDGRELGEDHLGQLAGRDGVVGRLELGEGLFPAGRELAFDPARNVGRLLRELGLVLLVEGLPLLLVLGAALGVRGVHRADLVGDDEVLFGVEPKLLLDLDGVVSLQRVAVDAVGTLVARTVTDRGPEDNEGRLVLLGAGLLDRLVHALEVLVAVLDVEDLPVVRLEALRDVLGEGDRGRTVDRDLVVVVDRNQVAELEVAGERSGFGRDTLHQATVAGEHVGVVVKQREVLLVEGGAEVSLRDRETDGVGETLTERTGGDLDTRGDADLRVTRRDRVELTELFAWQDRTRSTSPSFSPRLASARMTHLLEVIDGDLVAEEVEEDVLEGASVTVRKDEAVAVDVVRVGRVAVEEAGWIQIVSTRRCLCCRRKRARGPVRGVSKRLTEEEVGDGGHAHRRTRVTRVGLFHAECSSYRGTSRGGAQEERKKRKELRDDGIERSEAERIAGVSETDVTMRLI